MKKLLISLLFLFNTVIFTQTLSQSVKGIVRDKITQELLMGVNIEWLNSNPLQGAVSDIEGRFAIINIPVGRHSFKISMLGYKPYFIRELMVSSGKEINLEIVLEQTDITLEEFVVTYESHQPINTMATLSAQQFSVEETQKYAGGMDDPARLVSSFAGVSSPSVNNNGISVRGNSPSGLLWRIDGVEVPSPNHFADLIISGSGLLTILSGKILGNSDFFTGAFPAEYGNASSGVFDINLRKGNNNKREYSLGVGLLGLDFAAEGPFKQGQESSYLFNYRYSTLGLVSSLFPTNEKIAYQDLAFKVNFPTKKLGDFSIWGLGAYDAIKIKALDKDQWVASGDRENGRTYLNLFVTSINHKFSLFSKSSLNSSLAFSGYGLSHSVKYLTDEMVEFNKSRAVNSDYKFTLQSALITSFSESHINSTGIFLNGLFYNFKLADSRQKKSNLEEIVNEKGASSLFQFYTQSKFQLNPNFSLNMGVHTQYFRLNKKYSIEPRLALKYKLNERHNFSLAYGLHSKIEPLAIYFIKDSLANQPNKNLEIMKSHHFVLALSSMITENVNFTIEPYFQYLTDVPVAPDSYIAVLNNKDNLFFKQELISGGSARNLGVDFTLEHYLSNSFYYRFTASLFDSKYTPCDGIERNTRFNKNYVINALVGKEWQIGRNNNKFISANLRFNYLGGNRSEVIDEIQSLLQQEVVYKEVDGKISFEKKDKDLPIFSFTLSYRSNHLKYSSVLMLQVLNASNTKEFQSHIFNQKTQKVEARYSQNMIPNISYRIEF